MVLFANVSQQLALLQSHICSLITLFDAEFWTEFYSMMLVVVVLLELVLEFVLLVLSVLQQ